MKLRLKVWFKLKVGLKLKCSKLGFKCQVSLKVRIKIGCKKLGFQCELSRFWLDLKLGFKLGTKINGGLTFKYCICIKLKLSL